MKRIQTNQERKNSEILAQSKDPEEKKLLKKQQDLDLRERPITQGDLLEWLINHVPQAKEKLAGFGYNEETGEIALTHEGAGTILKILGYLHDS